MKIPRFITSGLASGVLRMRPEVLDVMKKLSNGGEREASAPPAEGKRPEPPASEQSPPAPTPPPCRSQRRLVFVSPLPGRWVRWSCLMLSCAMPGLTHFARAGDQPSAFGAANQAFTEGRAADAARGYESIITKQGYSVPVLFNLANARFRAGKRGAAILNYERARWLSPGDPDVDANLRLALEGVKLPMAAPSWPLRYADWFSLNGWGASGAVSLFLLAATLPLALLLPGARPALRLARIAAAVAVLGSVVAIGSRWAEFHSAVVTAKEASARLSPVTMGQVDFTLLEGATVSIVKSHGRFTLIRTPNGHQGWVNRDAVEPLVPTLH
jgi:hypothetical protein